MRSRSASMRVLSLGQGGAAADRLRTAPADHRARRRWSAGAQRVEQCLGRRPVQILVEIVIDLQDRRIDAGAEALDLDQGEDPVRRRAADADAELTLAHLD